MQILEVDPVKRRISLGPQADPAPIPGRTSPRSTRSASIVEGEVKNKTEFGLFIGLDGDVDGMVHLSDLDWNRPASRSSTSSRRATWSRPRCSTSTSRRSASRSASSSSPATPSSMPAKLKKGQVVTCEVTDVKDGGIEVKIVDTDLTAFIRRADLARDRADQRPERFAAGEKVDARVIQFDRKARKVQVSIKALEMAEEKEAIAQVRLVRCRRLARRHPRRRAARPQREEVTRRRTFASAGQVRKSGPAPGTGAGLSLQRSRWIRPPRRRAAEPEPGRRAPSPWPPPAARSAAPSRENQRCPHRAAGIESGAAGRSRARAAAHGQPAPRRASPGRCGSS